MIEAEGGVERGVTVPGAFSIDEDRPARADEDVFRTDVAVDKSTLRRCCYLHYRMEIIGKIGMNTGSSNKIGLETDRVERILSGELAANVLVVGCCCVDPY